MSNANRPKTVLDQPDSSLSDAPAAPPWASPRQSPAFTPAASPFQSPNPFQGRAATELDGGSAKPAPYFPQAGGGSPPPPMAPAGKQNTVWVPPERPAASGDAANTGGAAPAAAPGPATAPGKKITGWLVSADRLKSYTLHEGANRVGRGLENEIVLENPTISGFQCNLFCRDTTLHLMPDPRLTNPIEVNGEPVFNTLPIQANAKIRMGNSEWLIILLGNLLA
jgi:hypothetical protein